MASSFSPKERQLLWLLALTQFTIIMDFMVMMPLGPQIMKAFSISPAAFAIAVSAYSLCSGASGLCAATYIDRFDRRHLLLCAYALFTLSNLFCAMANSFHLLLAARAFAGLSGGVLSSLIMVIIGDVIPLSKRGEATGMVMTSFSMAAIGGVPLGVVLGAHFGWSAPFYLLVVLCITIWIMGSRIVPSISQHIDTKTEISQIIPAWLALFTNPKHLKAFVLTFTLMTSQMMVIPFISPVLVANYGIKPDQISWIYMAGGLATLFTSRRIGRLSDRHAKHLVFQAIALFSLAPILLVTHLPHLPLLGIICIFPFFMISMSSRMIPIQALLTTVPAPSSRGAFMSTNSALQSIGSGCGAWLGGLILATGTNGHIENYGMNGWVAVTLVIFTILWVKRIESHAQTTLSPKI